VRVLSPESEGLSKLSGMRDVVVGVTMPQYGLGDACAYLYTLNRRSGVRVKVRVASFTPTPTLPANIP